MTIEWLLCLKQLLPSILKRLLKVSQYNGYLLIFSKNEQKIVFDSLWYILQAKI